MDERGKVGSKAQRIRWGFIRWDVYAYLNRGYAGSQLPEPWLSRLKAVSRARAVRKISVVIPTRDRMKTLMDCALRGLAQVELADAEYEVIVVDNGSKNGTYSAHSPRPSRTSP
jgi:hypothetical protein